MNLVSRDRAVVLANLTGHPLSLVSGDGRDRLVMDVDGRARVNAEMEPEYRVHYRGIVVPLLKVTEQDIVGLPVPIPGMLYVVSGVVGSLAAKLGRTDVVSPGRMERDGRGMVTGARALIRLDVG